VNADTPKIDPVRTVHLVCSNDEDDPLCLYHFIGLSNEVFTALESVSFGRPDGYAAGEFADGFVMIAKIPASHLDALRDELAAIRKRSELTTPLRLSIIEDAELL
jgi:hypothetical protein